MAKAFKKDNKEGREEELKLRRERWRGKKISRIKNNKPKMLEDRWKNKKRKT